ncbi:unnamed protein product [Pleuronectes platessa]|uniref:Uncharacterized protein n=1 Tax=Pleuronectes platessa TaxID=8262 RepID=A0A9N7ZDP8_PLEPL|nr:unnamed protein product [Pleuronectes platessa]
MVGDRELSDFLSHDLSPPASLHLPEQWLRVHKEGNTITTDITVLLGNGLFSVQAIRYDIIQPELVWRHCAVALLGLLSWRRGDRKEGCRSQGEVLRMFWGPKFVYSDIMGACLSYGDKNQLLIMQIPIFSGSHQLTPRSPPSSVLPTSFGSLLHFWASSTLSSPFSSPLSNSNLPSPWLQLAGLAALRCPQTTTSHMKHSSTQSQQRAGLIDLIFHQPVGAWCQCGYIRVCVGCLCHQCCGGALSAVATVRPPDHPTDDRWQRSNTNTEVVIRLADRI